AGDKARLMYDKGDIEVGVVSAGQGLGLIHDIPTVKELFDRIMGEARQTVAMLAE
ncbi:MAG: nitronate monooxygenase, partial [Deltaproteobacteria bacterium]